MLFSKQQMFSEQQAITVTAVSTNVIDTLAGQVPIHSLGAVEKNLGKGTPICMSARVTEDFDLLTSLTVDLEVDDNEGFASAKVVRSQVVLLADLVTGKDLDFRYVPKGTDERYMRMNYTVTGTTATTGKIDAGIVCGHDDRWGV